MRQEAAGRKHFWVQAESLAAAALLIGAGIRISSPVSSRTSPLAQSVNNSPKSNNEQEDFLPVEPQSSLSLLIRA